MFGRTAFALPLLAAVALTAPADAQKKTPPRVDLADAVAGTYSGDVISDARGSSRSGVTITVTKTAPGTVSVSSSYRRLPPFTIKLTRAMATIQQVGTSVVFLYDSAKSPPHLDLTVDDASWSGTKN